MLVLTRQAGQWINLHWQGKSIGIKVVSIKEYQHEQHEQHGLSVLLGFDAPDAVLIVRDELDKRQGVDLHHDEVS